MFRDKARYKQDPKVVVRSKPATFNAPLKKLKGPLVFTCSWSDFFIEDADEWRPEAWDIIRRTPHLTYQILTKRSENILSRLPADWGEGWPNVWLGVSVESHRFLWRVSELANIPASLRWVSYEPALEYVDFRSQMYWGAIDWLVSGGESGPEKKTRPADVDWFLQVRDDCEGYGVPFFHKQHGGSSKLDGAWGGRELEGDMWSQFPKGFK